MKPNKHYVSNLITRVLKKYNCVIIPNVNIHGNTMQWSLEISERPGVPYKDRKIRYTDDGRLLDENGNSIMMGWEKPIMDFQANQIAFSGGDVLNVGFGMGLIDEAIQKYNPRSHTIIEIHPQIVEEMKKRGWDKKPGVRILHGDWRDFIYKLPKFDGIYIDIWDDDFKEFLSYGPNLLKDNGILTFFNNPTGDHDGDGINDSHKNTITENYNVEITTFDIPFIDDYSRQYKTRETGYWRKEWTQYKSILLRKK